VSEGAVDAVLRFYRLEGADARGRTLPEIWAWDDDRLEGVHDYIQWLFPLPESSAFNPQAPILTEATIEAFRADASLQARVLRSLTTMLRFYGLVLSSAAGEPPRIDPAPDFAVRSRHWLQPGDHNHLRLTRILTSVRLLGCPEHARALLGRLEAIAHDHPRAISATTLGYWQRAAS
jgi:hypothetical protein